MIKVLLVVCNNLLNGTERYVVDLASHLPPNKFDVTIATPLRGPLSDVISSKNLKEFIYENDKIEYYSFKGLWNLYKFIKKNKIDIVHANSKFQPCIVARLAKVKLTVETKHGVFYSKEQLENLHLWRRVYESIKQYFVDSFIATSENDKRTLVKYFKIKENKIDIIYLGLDFDDIKYKVVDDSISVNKSNKITIGHIGRFTFQKAQEVLIEAFRLLANKYENLQLSLVGTGENESSLKELVKNYQLEDKVIFKGYVDKIYSEMLSFDMHVLTSRFEGTGYVNLEAMALGIPVVASDVGGANNFFTNEYDILLTKVEDPLSTSQAIEKLIINKDLRQKLVNNAYQTVSKYTTQRMANETANFYISKISHQP